jgi:ClpP class serine protease
VYATFVADVAKFRGVDPALIRRTQAMTYYGADAIRAGLADQVATFDDAIAALNSRVSGTPARTPTGGMRMEHPTPGASLPPDKPTAEVIAISTAREQSAQAQAEGRLAGQQAEKLRCKTINGLATLARMPKATAQQLASRLIDDNSTVEAAQEAFLAAQVQADALASGGVELLGHTGAATVTSQVPVMQARANVIADRARRMSSRAALTRVVPQEGAL